MTETRELYGTPSQTLKFIQAVEASYSVCGDIKTSAFLSHWNFVKFGNLLSKQSLVCKAVFEEYELGKNLGGVDWSRKPDQQTKQNLVGWVGSEGAGVNGWIKSQPMDVFEKW